MISSAVLTTWVCRTSRELWMMGESQVGIMGRKLRNKRHTFIIDSVRLQYTLLHTHMWLLFWSVAYILHFQKLMIVTRSDIPMTLFWQHFHSMSFKDFIPRKLCYIAPTLCNILPREQKKYQKYSIILLYTMLILWYSLNYHVNAMVYKYSNYFI